MKNEYDVTKNMLRTIRTLTESVSKRKSINEEGLDGQDLDMHNMDGNVKDDITVINGVDVKLLSSDERDMELQEDQKELISKLIDSFKQQVSQMVDFEPGMTINQNQIRLDGKLTDEDVNFVLIAGEDSGTFINAEMLKLENNVGMVLEKLVKFEEIFKSSINIFDKPNIVKGLGSRYFDSEGVKTDELKLVDQGILKHYLVDTYNGKKLNLKSNGRSGGTSNLYFEKGSISYKDLLKLNQRTLYITETIGHGSNLVTGDYSVGATGFMVENGVFKYPVSEITIAGNFKDIFKNITLADDLEFKYSTNAPTMLIEGMVVAGK